VFNNSTGILEGVFGHHHFHEPLENACTGERLVIEHDYCATVAHIKMVSISRQPLQQLMATKKVLATGEEDHLASNSTNCWNWFTEKMSTCQSGYIYLDLPLKYRMRRKKLLNKKNKKKSKFRVRKND
jgi:hypothetical protein